MTELPHTIYIKGFTTYDILHRKIPSSALTEKRRVVTEHDLFLVNELLNGGEITPDALTTEVVTALVIVNDLIYTAAEDSEDPFHLSENPGIGYDPEGMYFVSPHRDHMHFEHIQNLVAAVNNLYAEYIDRMPKDTILVSKLRATRSRFYGENFELVLPSNVDKLTQENVAKVVFNKLMRGFMLSFNNLSFLRNMTACLVSQSPVRDEPTLMLIKNSSLSDFTSPKFGSLVQNSVFQLESNMNYSSPVQFAEHVVQADLIRSLITPISVYYFKNLFGSAYTADYLNTTDSPTNMIDMFSSIGSLEIVSFANEHNAITQVYLPVQSIVNNRKLNVMMLTAFFEAFAHIALINNKNIGEPINLILKYPSTAHKDDFDCIMLPMMAVIKNRNVKVIFYETDEAILKDSSFTYKEVQ